MGMTIHARFTVREHGSFEANAGGTVALGLTFE